jgi:adenine deaminase
VDKKKLISLARGNDPVDLVFKNAKVINVFTKTIEEGTLAISDGVFIGMGDYKGKEEIDLKGSYIAPGFIDGHVHIESSMLTPEHYGQVTIPRGTTTVVADCHEIANVLGRKGIDFMLEASEASVQDVFMMIPSCVPSTPYETSGAVLKAEDIQSYLKHPRVKGLGEMMDYVGTIHANEDVLKKIDYFSEKVIDGHAPGLMGQDLNAYVLAGVETDHECVEPNELIEKIKRGMYIHLRQGSQTKNVLDLLPGLSPEYYQRILLCSDDLHPYDMRHTGHIDHNVQLMIQSGLDPIQAISMATINSAQCYRLYKRGAIAPGYIADMVIFEDLYNLHVSRVYKDGKLVAKDHQALFNVKVKTNENVRDTIHLDDKSLDFTLRLKDEMVWVIGLIKNNVSTHKIKEKVALEDSIFLCRNNPGLLKLAVVERHHKTGNVGLGIVKGYGLKNGAVAMTVAHDSHNIICLGDSDEAMHLAVKEIKSIGGGIVLVSNGKVIGQIQLDVGGLMSSKSADYVIDQLRNLEEHIKTMGINPEIEDPFLQLAFLSLPVIPHLKVTDLGLFDVDEFKVIPLEVREKL